jgi:hypothetical protein
LVIVTSRAHDTQDPAGIQPDGRQNSACAEAAKLNKNRQAFSGPDSTCSPGNEKPPRLLKHNGDGNFGGNAGELRRMNAIHHWHDNDEPNFCLGYQRWHKASSKAADS